MPLIKGRTAVVSGLPATLTLILAQKCDSSIVHSRFMDPAGIMAVREVETTFFGGWIPFQPPPEVGRPPSVSPPSVCSRSFDVNFVPFLSTYAPPPPALF